VVKKRCRDGVACVSLFTTCLARTLPSVHLVSVVFGTAIPTSPYIFAKCFSYLFAYFFLHNSTLKEDVVPASFF